MILSFWKRCFPSAFAEARDKRAQALYLAVARQSRQPFFYADCAIPDTLQGRFEMLALHICLLLRHIKNEPETGRAVLEYFVSDMDRQIREMGAGDTGVGKRVRQMGEAFFGRMEAYGAALDGRASLIEALRRNAYATADNIEDQNVEALAQCVRDADRQDFAATILRPPSSQAPAQG
jgi:cytochrome b pre-mRNA-processing protein 3